MPKGTTKKGKSMNSPDPMDGDDLLAGQEGGKGKKHKKKSQSGGKKKSQSGGRRKRKSGSKKRKSKKKSQSGGRRKRKSKK